MRYLMMSLLGSSAAAITILFVVILLGLAIVYILAEVDGRRLGNRDPALGVKVATTLLLSICAQVFVLALAGFLAIVIVDGGEEAMQVSLGLLLGAIVAGILPLVIYLSKRGGGVDVGRKALGMNAIIFGLTFTSLTVLFMTMLVQGAKLDAFIGPWLIYTAAAVTTFLMLARTPTPAEQAGL
ncbi:MAG: hypothetical protein KC635_07110 [Myxococcales bacterium]|nr:hypothetical protein [Myxococcales bacterium]MCB9735572.1 hypothetical protein [Deltaproteobacteria bacterium]